MIRDGLRTVVVLGVAVRHLVAHHLGRLLGREHLSGPARLRRALEEVGGTYLKFGQVLSLQPDVLPAAYCRALYDLLDRVPPFGFDFVLRTFDEDLGASPFDLFDSFDSRPLASASVAQVHLATRDGSRFAVKVRRPDVERRFLSDLRLMAGGARLVRRLRIRSLAWLARAVEEFTSWTHEELDFRYEARYMAAMRFHAAGSSSERIPELAADLSSARILTAEYLDGPMVLDYLRSLEQPDPDLAERLEAFAFDPEIYARRLIENFVSDAFSHGLFHADLHPANLIILPDNVVGYVDFGITGSLSHYSRRNIVDMTLALTRGDAAELADRFFRIATAEPGADPDGYRRELDRLVAAWFRWEGDRAELQVSYTRVMLDFLIASRRTGIWAMPDALRYLRSVITADGLIGRFECEVDVSRDLEALCERYLEREMWQRWMTPESMADWVAAAARLAETLPGRVSGRAGGHRACGVPASEARGDVRSARRASGRAWRWAALTAVGAVLALTLPSPPGAGYGVATGAGTMVVMGAIMTASNLVRAIVGMGSS